jgi:hypothetical protein
MITMKIIKKFSYGISGLLLATLMSFSFAAPSQAIDVWGACPGGSNDAVCKAKTDEVAPIIRNIVSLLLWAVGVVSAIMIIIGGIKYATSNGDAQAIQSAKHTILYSVIGLIVAALGQAIILFVVGKL